MDKSNKFELLKSVICIVSMLVISIVFIFGYINEFKLNHPMIIVTLIFAVIIQFIYLRKYFSFRGFRLFLDFDLANLFAVFLEVVIMILLVPLNIVVLLILSAIDIFKILKDSN